MPGESREPFNDTINAAHHHKIAAQAKTLWATLKAASSAISAQSERLIISVFHLMTKLPGAILTGAIFFIFLKALFSADTVDLRSIEVPKALSDMGLTSKVVTWKLRDALNANRGRVVSQVLPTNLLVMQDLPEVTVPETTLSINHAVGIVRNLLPRAWQHDEIYGAFTLVGKRLSLDLRLNEKVVFGSSILFSLTDADVRDIQHQISAAAFSLTVQRYAGAIRNHPTSAPLRLALGYLWWDHGRRDSAIDSFSAALALDPSKPHAYAALGDIARKRPDPDLDEAQHYFQASLDRDPKHADAHTGMGYTYLAKSNLEGALHAFKQSGLVSGGSADSRVGLAHVYWRSGNLDKAVAELQEAVKLFPDAADPYILLGAARRKQRRLDDAIVAFEAAALLNPLSFEPHLGVGGAKLAEGRLDEALAEFGEAVRLYRGAFRFVCAQIAEVAVEAPSGIDYPEVQRRFESLSGGAEHCPSLVNGAPDAR